MMTNPATKPVLRQEVAIDWAAESIRIIYFWATPDSASEFSTFGNLDNACGDKYCLEIDPRYDF